jgi:hypothetical protein
MPLADCVPADKYDHAAIQRAEAVGFPALDPILGALLVWVQDMNWPVAPRTARLLREAGPEIAPPIIDVLRGGDDEWKWSILWEVAGHLRPEVWGLVAGDVERVARAPTTGEALSEANEAAAAAIRMQAERA